MPYFAYFLLEALAFWGVSHLIGVGWALAGIFILMVVGGIAASAALRTELQRASAGRATVGQLAGGTALVMVGWVMAIVPGYLTSIGGALLLFRPTRELMRKSMAASLQKRVEDFGIQVYDASSMGRQHATYGSFGDATQAGAPGDVIDASDFDDRTDTAGTSEIERDQLEAEFERWSKNARPEDFGDNR